MQVFLLVLLASHLQSHSPCVFPPVLFSLFSFQNVLSLSPFPGRLFLFALFPGWLYLLTVGFKSLPGLPPFSSDPAFWSELPSVSASFSSPFVSILFCFGIVVPHRPVCCFLGTLREIVLFALLLWCVMRRNEAGLKDSCAFQ